MSPGRPTNRSYSEKEIRALIIRATELHEEAKSGGDHRLSLEEIEHIAEELGVSVEHLRTAALELDNRTPRKNSFGLLGGPFYVDQHRVVDGELTNEQWDQIVMNIRSVIGKKGQVDEVGTAREWLHTFGEGDSGINFVKTRIALRPGHGQTSVEIRKSYAGTAIPIYLVAALLSVGFFLAATEAFPNFTALGIVLAIIFGTFAGIRKGITSWASGQDKELGKLAQQIGDTISGGSANLSHTEVLNEHPGLIDLPEPEDSVSDTTSEEQRARTR